MSILQSKEGKIISIFIADSVGAHTRALNLAKGCSASVFPLVQGFAKKVLHRVTNTVHPSLCFSIAPCKISLAHFSQYVKI